MQLYFLFTLLSNNGCEEKFHLSILNTREKRVSFTKSIWYNLIPKFEKFYAFSFGFIETEDYKKLQLNRQERGEETDRQTDRQTYRQTDAQH